MKRNVWLCPALMLIMGFGAGLVTFVNTSSAIRLLVSWPFLLLCPGLALISWLRIADVIAEAVLAVALSLALESMFALLMAWGGFWSPRLEVALLVGITTLCAVSQLAVGIRRRVVVHSQGQQPLL